MYDIVVVRENGQLESYPRVNYPYINWEWANTWNNIYLDIILQIAYYPIIYCVHQKDKCFTKVRKIPWMWRWPDISIKVTNKFVVGISFTFEWLVIWQWHGVFIETFKSMSYFHCWITVQSKGARFLMCRIFICVFRLCVADVIEITVLLRPHLSKRIVSVRLKALYQLYNDSTKDDNSFW